MKIVSTIVLFFIGLASLWAQPASTMHPFGNEQETVGCRLQTDGVSVWMTATYRGALTSDNGLEITSEQPAVFVAKYSSTDVCEWVVKVGDASQIKASALGNNGKLWLLTESNLLYSISASGVISAPVILSTENNLVVNDMVLSGSLLYVCGTATDRWFAAAYSLSGELQWQYTDSEYVGAVGQKIEVGQSSLFVAGACVGEGNAQSDLFAARLTMSGVSEWSCKITGSGMENLSAVAWHSNGKLLLAGSTTSAQLTVGRKSFATTSTTGTQHLFCLAIGVTGEYAWHYTAGSTTTGKAAQLSTLHVTANDEIYAGGYCMGKVIFNPSGSNRYNLPDKGAKDAILIKLSADAEVQDVKRFGTNIDESVDDLLFSLSGTRLFTLTNFKGTNVYGTFYNTTNLTLSGTAVSPQTAVGKEWNTVLSSYDYVRVFADHVSEGEKGIPYMCCFYHQGGFRKVSYSVVSGTLPDGMVLSSQGILQGTPNETGVFDMAVQGIDERGNSSIVSFSIQINGTNSDYSLATDKTGCKLYPNPTDEIFYVRGATADSPVSVSVVTLEGGLLLQQIVRDEAQAVNVSALPQGVYIVKCISGRAHWCEKLIKNKQNVNITSAIGI